ncbi:MAG: hypothetical protein ABL864_04835 [Terricaulis sp.]|jgi:hypothetical protein
MSIDDQAPAKARKADLEKRLAKLVAGRTIARVIRADHVELALELDDGSRVFARATGSGLDISVT